MNFELALSTTNLELRDVFARPALAVSRVYTDLHQLAQAMGMPKCTALDNLVQVELSDKTLQAAVTRVAVARTIA